MRGFFAHLQARGLSPSRQHQAYRTLKTFFRWGVEVGVLTEDPLRGFTMRTPKTLPNVPTEDELRAVLAVCPDTLEGVRNRALILVLADSGLRAGEVLHLLVETGAGRTAVGSCAEGRAARTAWHSFIGPTTTRALKAWLARHPLPSPEAFMFCDRKGRPARASAAAPARAPALRGHELAAGRSWLGRGASAAGA